MMFLSLSLNIREVFIIIFVLKALAICIVHLRFPVFLSTQNKEYSLDLLYPICIRNTFRNVILLII